MSDQLAELLQEAIRHEQSSEQALTAYDAFADRVPATLISARGYLAAARQHTFTCLDPALRSAGAPRRTGRAGHRVLERLMRELNARTDIGARPLEHPRAARPTHRAYRTAPALPRA